LRRVREDNPADHIIYKPHPDVEAGHRLGAIPDDESLKLANEIVQNGPISSWIQLVDEVHVNTSLAGFEALLRGKTVITYGVPFYAGWGLSRDLGPIPNRRNAKRSIDELVAAALLLYPRYLDPVTGLPCPPEILVRRITEGSSSTRPTRLVRIRRLQGRLKRSLAGSRPVRK
jgi:capsular polysaccharide export protein